MSQHDYNIANGGGAAVRADINNALAAILSQNSGATAPTTTKPFMLWYDTANSILKIRNAADNAWVNFMTSAGFTLDGVTVGKGAGSVATNTAVGASALDANTTGASNTGIGYQALLVNTDGAQNTAVGRAALIANVSGAYNVAVGRSALLSNTTANYNTAVGYQAGYNNTTGAYNLYLGYNAGYSKTTGNYNTFVGGINSGYYMTTGASNTIIGNFSGNQGGLDIRTASNYIVLSDGDGNPRGIFDATGTFYVGGITPSADGTGGIASKTTNANGQNLTLWNTATSGTRYFGYFGVGSTFTNVGAITSNGSSTSYVTSSDYRLKENVQPMQDALAIVAQLKPCTYTWKVDGSAGQGFIAHELQEVVPDAVNGEKDAVNEDGSIKPQGIDTSFLVGILTAAIQELKAEIDALKGQA